MNPTVPKTPAANILIVDDTPANLQLLSHVLQDKGYKPRPVPSGEVALRAADALPPDLILLDITMPGMDGYQTCTNLKQNPKLADVPIIFVTARHEADSKVRGFNLGAVDYITKPFQFEEVEARVQLHLELARLRREQERHVSMLEEAVAQRTRELSAAKDRLAILDQAKSDFLSLISHEVRTPLHGLLGVTEMLLEFSTDPQTATCRELYEQSRQRLMTLIDDALLLSQVGASGTDGAEETCALDHVLQDGFGRVVAAAAGRTVQLAPAPSGLGVVRGASDVLVRAIESLLGTAVKFARPGSTVRLTGTAEATFTQLLIEAEGQEVPPALVPRFFDLLAIAEPIAEVGDLGLGPALAERIVSLYGGTVSLENLTPPESGSWFACGLRLILPEKSNESSGLGARAQVNP